MSLPTNTWISVNRVNELPKANDKWSIQVDITEGYIREMDCQYNFETGFWFKGMFFTPTHFMIIELPK